MRASEFIVEAIPLSQYRRSMKGAEWYNYGKKIDYKERYSDIFGGKMRLYFPVEGATAADMPASHAGTGVTTNLTNLLAVGGYTHPNFKDQTVQDKHGRTVRIGRAFNAALTNIDKMNKGDPFWDNFVDQGKRAYQIWARDNQKDARALRDKASSLMVVITRHPYDIAGMSTGRDWTSCMNLNTGTNKSFIEMDIAYGTIAAYLTRTDDKDLKSPLARILIKPFENLDTGEILFGIEGKTYPPEAKSIPNWLDVVRSWVDNVNKKAAAGYYQIVSGLYRDDMPNYIEKE